MVRIGRDDRTVFTAPEGGPLDYKNFRDRVGAPLLGQPVPTGSTARAWQTAARCTCCATALIQSGENAKTMQTLMGHHSVAFTIDEYADAWPEQIGSAGEAAAR